MLVLTHLELWGKTSQTREEQDCKAKDNSFRDLRMKIATVKIGHRIKTASMAHTRETPDPP